MINKNIIIKDDITIIQALKLMDEVDRKLLIICDGDIFKGVLSIGDIQRALLKQISMQSPVKLILRSDITIASSSQKKEEILAEMKRERIECMPVVNEQGILVDTLEWATEFGIEYKRTLDENYPVVIMAGGKGTRLKPLTNLIPKPLVPISDKTVIEEIIHQFTSVGCKDFFVSINHMGDLIKEFFKRKNITEYNINFIEEEKPLGTAGSLYLLKDKLDKTFFVSNCDIIVDVDFKEMMKYHKENNNIITALSVVKDFSIPYGTLETKENGKLVGLREKPKMIYQINSGVYILEPEALNYISDNEFIHITTLMQRLIDDNKNVGVFPISDGSYFDMGNWDEYNKVIEKYK